MARLRVCICEEASSHPSPRLPIEGNVHLNGVLLLGKANWGNYLFIDCKMKGGCQ